MTHRFAFSATISIAILASVTTACGPNAAQPHQASTSSAEQYQPTPTSPPPAAANSTQPSPTLTTVPISTASIPADLHFSPAGIAYLESVDARTREAAIQRRRDEIQAQQRASKMTEGYTDSLKAWSISTAKTPKTH